MGCCYSDLETDDMSLNFLVILKKKDFSKTIECLNKKNKITRTLRKLPGNVHIIDFDDNKYTIKGLKMPYVLYAKLPKENIYVTSDTWDSEYFNSQILELVHIFTMLGGLDIKFAAINDYGSEKTQSLGVNICIPNMPLKISAEMEHITNEENSNSLGGFIRIRSTKKIEYENVDDFINKNKLYYSKFYPEWKTLISFKLNNSITKMDFEYKFNRGFYCSSSLGTDMEKNGISCKLTSAINNYTTVRFNVNF